jgi:hypothetical protein
MIPARIAAAAIIWFPNSQIALQCFDEIRSQNLRVFQINFPDKSWSRPNASRDLTVPGQNRSIYNL